MSRYHESGYLRERAQCSESQGPEAARPASLWEPHSCLLGGATGPSGTSLCKRGKPPMKLSPQIVPGGTAQAACVSVWAETSGPSVTHGHLGSLWRSLWGLVRWLSRCWCVSQVQYPGPTRGERTGCCKRSSGRGFSTEDQQGDSRKSQSSWVRRLELTYLSRYGWGHGTRPRGRRGWQPGTWGVSGYTQCGSRQPHGPQHASLLSLLTLPLPGTTFRVGLLTSRIVCLSYKVLLAHTPKKLATYVFQQRCI